MRLGELASLHLLQCVYLCDGLVSYQGCPVPCTKYIRLQTLSDPVPDKQFHYGCNLDFSLNTNNSFSVTLNAIQSRFIDMAFVFLLVLNQNPFKNLYL